MRTPSLRRRVALSSIAVFTLLVVALNLFVFFALRDQLEDTLAEVLAARAELARELDVVLGPEELAARLQASGVPVVVTTTDGQVFEGEPAVPRFREGPPGAVGDVPYPRESTIVELDDGGTAEVFATRAGVEGTLRRVLVLMTIGTVVALAAAILLGRRAIATAMAPLDQVIDAAHRTTAGQAGERLDPDNPATELGRLAVAYDAMLDELEGALAQTRAAEERTRRFLDDAAHQLRTPIAGVRSSVESLLRETDPVERDRLMTNLVRETARASRLLHSLLVLARLDDDRGPEVESTDLIALCRDEVERAESLAPQLELTLRHSEPALVLPLAERSIREVLANLLDNARRHARTRIDVGVAVGDGLVEVRVDDDGPGVPDEDRERIFERFVSTDDVGGSGLGLAIGRAIARRHGGDLAYDDAFVLRLPTARLSEAADQGSDAGTAT